MPDLFSPDKIKETIEKELNKGNMIPSGKKEALIAHVDENGASLVVAKKLGSYWQVGGVVGWDRKEKWEFGVNVLYSR